MMTRDVLLERELEDDDDEDGDIGELGVLRVGQLGALRPHPKARADAGGSPGPRVGAAPLAVEVGGNPRPLGGARAREHREVEARAPHSRGRNAAAALRGSAASLLSSRRAGSPRESRGGAGHARVRGSLARKPARVAVPEQSPEIGRRPPRARKS